ncbi:ATP-binding protein [Streptomyces sp. NPDC060205]|uniref:ATP-binding protein n=1 Tax=Streptomyces sp. NPDC060205 TaxID=3347072 RepID=UPI003650F247
MDEAGSSPGGEGGLVSQRPLVRDSVVLDGDGSVIAEARHHAVGFLARAEKEHGVVVSARARDLTQLVVSELVTNAYKHAPGPVSLELCVIRQVVEVAVSDSDPALPVAHAADTGRVGQHGLEIVMAVAQGFEVRQEPAGKRVIVRIALCDDPGGDVRGRTQ